MADNPVIIAGSLSDDDLKKSIDKLVETVKEGTSQMATNFDTAIDGMKRKLSELGNTKVDLSKVFGDTGGTSKMASSQDRLSKSVKETTMTYDQMAQAVRRAIDANSGMKSSFSQAELQQYTNLLRTLQAEYVKVNTTEGGGVKTESLRRDIASLEEIITKYKEILKNVELVNSRQGTIDIRKWTQDLGAVDERYKKLARWYSVLEKEDQRRSASQEREAQKRIAAQEKEEQKRIAAQEKMIQSAKKAEEVYQNTQLKVAFNKALLMPTDNIDQMAAKLERLKNILSNTRDMNILQPAQIARAEVEISRLSEKIQRLRPYTTKEIGFQVVKAEEIKKVETLEQRVQSLSKVIKEYFIKEGQISFSLGGTNATIFDPNVYKNKLSVEEQVLRALQEEEKQRQRITQEVQKTTQAIKEQPVSQKIATETRTFRSYDDFREAIAAVLNISKDRIQYVNIETASNERLSQSLKQLKQAYNKLGVEDKSSIQGKGLLQEIQMIERALQKARAQASRPIDLRSALGLSEKTLDDIAYKMRMLSSYRLGLDTSKQRDEIRQVNEEYTRLQKRMNELMDKNTQMTNSNNALARSWSYMKNRLAFYFTVGASTQFVKNLIEVRSQYEMNERALGILVDSAERGTQIFNELSQMALVSPYTLIELSTAAKQLTAYDIAAKDVVDTTRRLADMASAVGVPIERLTYALGQIKAYGYLNSRDARMFANAGIPLVKNLSDYYTQLEGRLVSVSDIYDRIHDKAISYNDVMQVVTSMTDEGGKFFDFQAKMAENLKVKIANLTLAWNNMLNDIGKSNQGILSSGIGALKELFLHWKELNKIINDFVVVLGIAATANILLNYTFGAGTGKILARMAATKTLTAEQATQLVTTKTLTQAEAKWLIQVTNGNKQIIAKIVQMKLMTQAEADAVVKTNALGNAWRSLCITMSAAGKVINTVGAALSAFATQMIALAAIMAVVDIVQTFKERHDAIKKINDDLVRNAKESSESINKYLNSIKYGSATELSFDDQQKAWERVREEIETATNAANVYMARLMQIQDIGERTDKANNLLRQISEIQGLMTEWHANDVEISQDFKILGIGADGLTKDLDDFLTSYNKAIRESNDAIDLSTDATNGLAESWERVVRFVREWGDFFTHGAYIPFIEDISQAASAIAPPAWIEKLLFGGDIFGWQLDGLLSSPIADVQIDLNELNDEVDDFVESLYKKLSKEGIEDPFKIREALTKTLSSAGYIGEQLETVTILSERKLRDIYQNNNLSAATESAKKEWDEQFAYGKTSVESFLKYVKNRNSSLFSDITEEELNNGEWLTEERQKQLDKYLEDFKKTNALAYQDLQSYVGQANGLSVYIPVIFGVKKAPTDVQKDFMQRTGYLPTSAEFAEFAKNAKSQTDVIDAVKKKQKEAQTALDAAQKAGGEYWANNEVKLRANLDKLTSIIHSYNALTDAEEKAEKGSKKDKVLDALKQEISIVKELQSEYDKLTKSGANQADALEAVQGAFGKTLTILNKELKGYGLPELDLSIITGKDPHKQLEHFKKTLDDLVSKGLINFERAKALEAEISKLTISAKTYDLDKITKGLNSELSKLKDEYELAVELDANPELGGMFADMFGIDTTDMPHTIDEYMKRVQAEFDKRIEELGYSQGLDVFKASANDWEQWAKSVGLSEDALKSFNSKFLEAQGIAKKWATDVVTQTKKLQYDLADVNGKIDIENKQLDKLRADLAKETNEAQRDLLELQIQEQVQKIARLVDEALQLLPTYKNLFNSIVEHSSVVTKRIAKQWKDALENAVKNADGTYTITDPTSGQKTTVSQERYGKELDKVNAKLRETQNSFKKLKEAFTKGEDGMIDWVKGVELVGDELQKLSQLVSTIGNIAEGLGFSEDAVEIINDVATSISGAATVAEGIGKLASGDYIGGAASILSGAWTAVSTWLNDSDKRIAKQIEKSERAVKRLELTYIDLEHEIENAYGIARIGAQKAAIANKELQLVELKRQLTLEQSRKGKNRDEDRIIQLQKDIRQLQYEIEDSTNEIINDLLGISSVGDAMESLMDGFIEALRNGEDAMAVFNESVDNMIANMVKKMFATKILQPWFEEQWNKIQSDIDARTKSLQEELKTQMARASGEDSNDVVTYWDYETQQYLKGTKKEIKEKALERIPELQKLIAEASLPAVDDIARYAEMLRSGKITIEEWMDYLNGVLTDLDLMNKGTNDKGLSALSAGIQNITEETANAVEAILNSVSQQVYYQSDVLTEIRDTLTGFDMDIQMASLSQILLQLQASYSVQMSIQNILEGWSNASGQAIRVELID